jgi:predicted RecB family nuclease
MAEASIVELLEGEDIKTQIYTTYRGVVGYLDLLIDGHVVEIKSVGHDKWKSLKDAKRAHALQACDYALSLQKNEFGVLYIDSDTYLTKLYCYNTAQWSPIVDKIIDNFEAAKDTFTKNNMVPGFVGLERNHNVAEYNPYPAYAQYSGPFSLLQ